MHSQKFYAKRHRERRPSSPTERTSLLGQSGGINNSPEEEEDDKELVDKIKLTLKEGKEEKEKERLTLLGLTWVSS